MPQTNDPRDSLNFLQRLLTSKPVDTSYNNFNAVTGRNAIPAPRPPVSVAPQQTQTPQAQPAQAPARSGFKIPPQILQMLPQLIALGVGASNKRALPGAAGFSTGYGTGIQRARKETLERDKLSATTETKQWDDAYKTALELSKTGPMGCMQEMNPAQLDGLARQVMEIKYGKKQAGANVPTGGVVKPPQVAQKDWDAASEKEKTQLLNALGQ